MRADAHVVGDHDQVVELHALLDHGIADGAAIDGGVRADIHVVADDHRADLRHLHPGALLGRKAEAVAADDRAGMDDAACADLHVAADEDPRQQPRVIADHGAVFDDACPDR